MAVRGPRAPAPAPGSRGRGRAQRVPLRRLMTAGKPLGVSTSRCSCANGDRAGRGGVGRSCHDARLKPTLPRPPPPSRFAAFTPHGPGRFSNSGHETPLGSGTCWVSPPFPGPRHPRRGRCKHPPAESSLPGVTRLSDDTYGPGTGVPSELHGGSRPCRSVRPGLAVRPGRLCLTCGLPHGRGSPAALTSPLLSLSYTGYATRFSWTPTPLGPKGLPVALPHSPQLPAPQPSSFRAVTFIVRAQSYSCT